MRVRSFERPSPSRRPRTPLVEASIEPAMTSPRPSIGPARPATATSSSEAIDPPHLRVAPQSSMERVAAPSLVHVAASTGGELACLDLVVVARGARLGSGGGSGKLSVWEWQRGEGWRLRSEKANAHRYGVTCVRWAPGAGGLLASGGVDGAIRVWGEEGEEGELACRRELAAPGAVAVRSLTWLGRGRGARLVAGHDDGCARVWGARRGVMVVKVGAQEGALHAVAVVGGGTMLLTACTEGTLKVFDLLELENSQPEEEATPLVWIDGAHDMGALCADSAPDGKRVATGGHDARIRLWSLQEGRRGQGEVLKDEGALGGHAAAVTALRWGKRGVLASASLDRSARLWMPTEGACLHVVQAHSRYLTCVALAPDLSFMITGSNDRSFRTWSLGAFSLDTELQPPCNALAHFAIGDLEGIGPVEADEDAPESDRATEPKREEGDDEDDGGGGTCCVWSERAHSGAINCIAAHGEFLATASSDGSVKVWRWSGDAALSLEHTLEAHRYPALACDFGAFGSVLLTGGLDGCAYLWDVQTGVQVRSLSVPGGEACGGGGVRGARLSPQNPPRALLATDDGLAPLWNVAKPDPQPARVYGGLSGAAACCAWSMDARLCAVGGADGELRLLAPPYEHPLHHDSQAHDLGVTSCDFTPSVAALELPESRYLLATAGNDSLIKLWTIELREEESEEPRASAHLSRRVEAHGGGVADVRWGWDGGLLLASAGDDRWARVWSVEVGEGEVRVSMRATVSVASAGGALAVLPVRRLLAVGALGGQLALWRIAASSDARTDDEAAPHFWREAAVARWLKDYVSRSPDLRMSHEREEALLQRAREERISGPRLLDAPMDDIVASLGYGEEEDESEDAEERASVRARILEELAWLREEPPAAELASSAPHSLLCPLTHALFRWPTRAADGFTYERDNIHEWLLAAPPEGAVSPVTGRRLSSTRLAPNYKLQKELRDFLRQHASLDREANQQAEAD